MKTLIALAMLLASTGYAFAPVAQQSDVEKIESTVWCVFQDKNLVDIYMAILWHESRYNHGAVGYNTDGSYDFGVAQLNSRYWNPAIRYYDADIRTMRGNVYAGAKFFAALVDQFGGDAYDAVTAYNCGAGAVMRGLVPDCSRKYASRVLATAAMRRA